MRNTPLTEGFDEPMHPEELRRRLCDLLTRVEALEKIVTRQEHVSDLLVALLSLRAKKGEVKS